MEHGQAAIESALANAPIRPVILTRRHYPSGNETLRRQPHVQSHIVVTDSNGQVFAVDPAVTGTFAGSISLNLNTGEVSATWTVKQSTSTITGYVRSVADLDAPPSDRFMFVIPQDDAGFYVLTTTNI